MSLNDPMADLLNRIRNGAQALMETVEVPHSRMKEQLCRVLVREGFLGGVAVEGTGAAKRLRIRLKYDKPAGLDRQPVIRGVRRVSRPGCRRYARAGELRSVRSGTGVAVLTTSRGLMTDREARRQRLGGEVICHVW